MYACLLSCFCFNFWPLSHALLLLLLLTHFPPTTFSFVFSETSVEIWSRCEEVDGAEFYLGVICLWIGGIGWAMISMSSIAGSFWTGLLGGHMILRRALPQIRSSRHNLNEIGNAGAARGIGMNPLNVAAWADEGRKREKICMRLSKSSVKWWQLAS